MPPSREKRQITQENPHRGAQIESFPPTGAFDGSANEISNYMKCLFISLITLCKGLINTSSGLPIIKNNLLSYYTKRDKYEKRLLN